MKIKYMSDLHLEFDDATLMPRLEPNADVLILAGDITVGKRNWDWIERQLLLFPNVFYIPGNHEFYHKYMNEVHDFYEEKDREFKQFHYFGAGRTKVIEGIRFIGTTLWSNCFAVPKNAYHIQYGMNDFHLISKFSDISTTHPQNRWKVEDATEQNAMDADFIRHTLDDKPCIVFTHHAPSYKSVGEAHIGSPLNAGYATDLEDIMQMQNAPKYWIHGHMHESVDYVVGNTNVISNPRGYVRNGERGNDSFNPNKVIEI